MTTTSQLTASMVPCTMITRDGGVCGKQGMVEMPAGICGEHAVAVHRAVARLIETKVAEELAKERAR
jgi:hypothetical protein